MRYHIGIDPGKTGGMAILRADGEPITKKLDDAYGVHHCLTQSGLFLCAGNAHVFIEQLSVHGMKHPGAIVSLTKLFRHQGVLIGIVTALGLPHEFVVPAKWQRAMGCLTKGDKKVSYRKAQELFPNVKVTHWNADALLIAEHCRRTCNQRNGTPI